MTEDLFKRLIRAVIELFPIDAAKKTDILQNIVKQKHEEEES